MHKLLEDYVSQVTSPNVAVARSAEAERDADANEIRQHLSELMQGHQELGLDEDEAAEAAIVQFGQARTVRRELKRVSLRGVIRDRAFWFASAVATLTQIILNAAGGKWLGYDGKVTAIALVQLYSDRRLNFLFALIWLVQLIVIGKIAARLCPRGALLAASLFGIYQAVAAVVITANRTDFPQLPIGFFCVFCLMMSVPPATYALFAWAFARRQMARLPLRA